MSARDRESLATRASYVGSAYHKDTFSFVGQARPRTGAISAARALEGEIANPDCTICPPKWSRRQAEATALLRAAIVVGSTSDDLGPDTLPGRVWVRDPEDPALVYEARRLSYPSGGYKAYPLTPFQARVIPVDLP